MVHLGARQVGWQRGTTRRLFRPPSVCHRGELFEFLLDGRDVGVQGFVQEAALSGVQALAGGSKLSAPQQGDLVRELVDLGLLEVDLAVLGGDDPVVRLDDALLVAGVLDQATQDFAQLHCVESIEVIELGYMQHDTDDGAAQSSCLSGQSPIAVQRQ